MTPLLFNGIDSNHGLAPIETPVNNGFYPYTDNGGSSLAIAGDDYCILGSDTRHSTGYVINTRCYSKAYKLTDKAVFVFNGFNADGLTLVKKLKQRIEWYKHAHDKEMSIEALAQMLSITLYMKRFFPFYTFNILAGLDEKNQGVVYNFDPVGSFEAVRCKTGGSSGSLIQPFLDNQVEFKNQK
jgi:20S proteasome subunit beta 6